MKYTYESTFASYIVGLIRQKQSDGFAYNDDIYHLKKFDEFCVKCYPDSNIITGDIAAEWSVKRPTESRSYRRRRLSSLRQLCLYMQSLGLESYVPHSFGATDKPVLYIPSSEEVSYLFEVLDALPCRTELELRLVNEYRMLFRLYYCCGLRLSEARLLKKENVDFDKGILTILESKGHKNRLVYLPQDGIKILKAYLLFIEKKLPGSQWLFPGQNQNNPISKDAIRWRFKKCWNLTPFAAKADKPPTPHCLRHAFVVERINDWMRCGIELQTMLPYLSSYLGHNSPSETFYYYHLVDKAFTIIKQKDKMSERVIPEVSIYEEV